ncbi:hypothetical protein AURDEDRAFT_162391 [Auricularia subglabra TFB-10046 SS5]|nr:hypothetical protein AURDEDRAFT_162391 [Auricularia subglabra TFB-10046 SS5]
MSAPKKKRASRTGAKAATATQEPGPRQSAKSANNNPRSQRPVHADHPAPANDNEPEDDRPIKRRCKLCSKIAGKVVRAHGSAICPNLRDTAKATTPPAGPQEKKFRNSCQLCSRIEGKRVRAHPRRVCPNANAEERLRKKIVQQYQADTRARREDLVASRRTALSSDDLGTIEMDPQDNAGSERSADDGYANYEYEPGAYEDGTYNGGTYEDGTYEDGAYEDGTYEDGAYEDGTYEDDAYEDGAREPGAYEEGTYEEGTYEEGTYEEGTYEEGAYEDGAREDGAPADAANLGGAPADGAQNGAATTTGTSLGIKATNLATMRLHELSGYLSNVWDATSGGPGAVLEAIENLKAARKPADEPPSGNKWVLPNIWKGGKSGGNPIEGTTHVSDAKREAQIYRRWTSGACRKDQNKWHDVAPAFGGACLKTFVGFLPKDGLGEMYTWVSDSVAHEKPELVKVMRNAMYDELHDLRKQRAAEEQKNRVALTAQRAEAEARAREAQARVEDLAARLEHMEKAHRETQEAMAYWRDKCEQRESQ